MFEDVFFNLKVNLPTSQPSRKLSGDLKKEKIWEVLGDFNFQHSIEESTQ